MEDLKSYNLMIEYGLEIDTLPEKIRLKVDMMEELLEQYENAQDETEAKDISLKIDSCDQGLYEDVKQYLAQVQKSTDLEEEEEEEENKTKSESIPIQQYPQEPSKPTWRFWM